MKEDISRRIHYHHRYCQLFKAILITDVTHILSQIEAGDPSAAEQLLPLVYEELRKLAAAKLSQEKPGQTLEATALVHEAYLRLVNGNQVQHWNSRGHFFGAAAEGMRRILIENARRKLRGRHGGDLTRVDLDQAEFVATLPPEELLDLDDAIENLAEHDLMAADLVKLRYFAGLSVEQAAAALNISRTNAYRHWAYARAWLFNQIHGESESNDI